jgi:hypothetical protein
VSYELKELISLREGMVCWDNALNNASFGKTGIENGVAEWAKWSRSDSDLKAGTVT